MKIVVAPDKFKGSLTSFEVCTAIEKGIKQQVADASIELLPMADGGDGFATCLKHYLGTQTINTLTVDPLGRTLIASYEWQPNTKTAIIEMAAASGIVLLAEDEKNPLLTSTYGTGLQIKDAIQKGAETIIVGLGGSATNDAGMGILVALGFKFYDDNNQELSACGKNLYKVCSIKPPNYSFNCQFIAACDVNNTMYGPNGAAYVYAPQKGASASAVKLLDAGLRNFEVVLNTYAHKAVGHIPGTGAAGAVVAGLLPWFNLQLVPGIDLILEESALKEKLIGADLLITGEGKFDFQTLQGKVVGALANLCKQNKVAVGVITGTSDLNTLQWNQSGIKELVALTNMGYSPTYCMQNAAQLVTEAAQLLLQKFNLYEKNSSTK